MSTSETIFQKRRRELAAFLITKVAEAEAKQGRRKLFQGTFYSGVKDPNNPKISLTGTRCGTSACALGWASTLWPKKMKLEYNGVSGKGEYADYDDISLGREFFGVDHDTSCRLFGPESATPAQKAAQLLEAEDALCGEVEPK